MFKKLSFRMNLLLSILPVVIIGMLILSFIVFSQFRSTIDNQIISDKKANTASLSENINTWLEGKLLEVRSSADTPTARSIQSDISSTDKFNAERIKFLNKTYPGEYDNAASALYNNDGKSRAQYANGNFVIGDVSKKPWYKALMGGSTYHISNPVVSKGTGKTISVIGSQIKDDSDSSIGLMMSAVNLTYVENKVKNFKFGEKGYAMLIGSDGTLVVYPDKSLVMKKKLSDVQDTNMKLLDKKMLTEKSGTFSFIKNNEKFMVFYNKVPLSGWSIASVVSENELFAAANKMMLTLLLIASLIVIIIGIIIGLVANRIASPLIKLSEFSEKISKGSLKSNLSLNRNDEIGKVASSMNNTVFKLKGMVGSISDSANEVNLLSNSLNSTTYEYTKGTEELSKSMQVISEGAIKQAENASNASSLTSELVDYISTILNQCNNMIEVVESSIKVSNSGSEAVKEAVDSIEVIAKSNNYNVKETQVLFNQSNEIGEIVNVISNIASQTNLLALNAAIEAARAGEQGKGFAVVADEVKKLAEQSGDAATHIAELITGIQKHIESISQSMNNGTDEVAHGVTVASNVVTSFENMEKVLNNITDMVNKVSQTANNMSEKADTSLESIENVATVAEGNSAITEQITATTEEQTAGMYQIVETTKKLDALVLTLKNSIEQFEI